MVPLIYRDGHDNFIPMHNGTSGYNNITITILLAMVLWWSGVYHNSRFLGKVVKDLLLTFNNPYRNCLFIILY